MYRCKTFCCFLFPSAQKNHSCFVKIFWLIGSLIDQWAICHDITWKDACECIVHDYESHQICKMEKIGKSCQYGPSAAITAPIYTFEEAAQGNGSAKIEKCWKATLTSQMWKIVTWSNKKTPHWQETFYLYLNIFIDWGLIIQKWKIFIKDVFVSLFVSVTDQHIFR